jgi:hypothetical protein
MGLDRINRTNGIRQDKEFRLECTGPREQTGLCSTKMTNRITHGQERADRIKHDQEGSRD